MNTAIADIRKDYRLKSLNEADVNIDPVKQFTTWWVEAMASEIQEVNAMTLATSTSNGIPSARIVLLKDYDANGFVFFTNYNSKKGRQLAINPQAALVFFWKELERQVCIQGKVERLSEAESDAYFNSRPEGSRLGAWASPQSQVIEKREVIDDNLLKFQQEFASGIIPRPPYWGGFRVMPITIEFWQGRSNRLHDRIVYTQNDGDWSISRVAP